MKLHCRLNRLWCILPMCAFIAAFFIGCTISRSDSVPSSSSEPLPAATPAPTPRTLMEGIAPMPIASSYITYYAIQTDGTLIGWGENLRGLINYPDSLPSYEDAVVMMEDVAAVYAGDWVTLILCSDGTLWGVGSGLFGLLPERAASQDAYDPLFLMSDVVMAAVSSESACALRSDGTVWSWGGLEGFQPEQILKGIVKIAAYSSGHYALDIDGTLYIWGSLLPLEVDRNECWLTPQPILEGVTDMASTGRRLLVQKGDSSLWRMGWWEGYQYQPLEKWMDNVVYFTADLAVTGDHTLWYLASDTPSMIMNNVACAVNGEQGILALDWDGGLWLHPQEGDDSADAVHLCDDIWVPESWYSQQQSRNTD